MCIRDSCKQSKACSIAEYVVINISDEIIAVSYTHLDVYKRQVCIRIGIRICVCIRISVGICICIRVGIGIRVCVSEMCIRDR